MTRRNRTVHRGFPAALALLCAAAGGCRSAGGPAATGAPPAAVPLPAGVAVLPVGGEAAGAVVPADGEGEPEPAPLPPMAEPPVAAGDVTEF